MLTLPTLLFCCAYASGVLKNVAPHSWHPIQAAPVSETGLGAPLGHRIFGLALAGNALPSWCKATGIHPELLMSFQSWAGEPMPTRILAEDHKVGIHAAMITWEPWQTPPDGNVAVQYKVQPAFTNRDIANGDWDGYIRKWASAVAKFPQIRVYIRFAHEMNGKWYPWSHNPRAYIAAWRHVVRIFRHQHVTNARFVWSASVGYGMRHNAWRRSLLAYWPGRSYVDLTGITMINFGGTGHTHPVGQFTPRLASVHRLFHKPVLLTEVDTQYAGRAQWMGNLAAYAARTHWLKGAVWSQLFSRGAADMHTGNMGWQVTGDRNPQARQAFRELAMDIVKPVNPPGLAAPRPRSRNQGA